MGKLWEVAEYRGWQCSAVANQLQSVFGWFLIASKFQKTELHALVNQARVQPLKTGLVQSMVFFWSGNQI